MTAVHISKRHRPIVDVIKCMVCEQDLTPAEFRRHWHEIDPEEAIVLAHGSLR
jgi:hypothetical protein